MNEDINDEVSNNDDNIPTPKILGVLANNDAINELTNGANNAIYNKLSISILSY
jgi:hypothetical protein